MTLPNASITVRNGGLGQVPASAGNIHVKIGACTQGTKNTVLSFSDPRSVVDTLGSGPLVEALCYALNASTNGRGPSTVLAIRADTTTAASCSAVTKTPATVTGSGAVTVSVATGYDSYRVKILITLSGDVGTARFRYSLDDGNTYEPEALTAATYAIPGTGLTIAFGTGAGNDYEANDLFSFECFAPMMVAADFNTAFDALMAAEGLEWSFVHLVGHPTGADNAAKATALGLLVTAMKSKIEGATALGQYAFGVLDGVDVSDDSSGDNAVNAALASTESDYVMVGHGFDRMLNPSNGRIERRPDAWSIVSRIASVPISEDPIRVLSGGVPAIVASQFTRSEGRATAIDNYRLTTLRRHRGYAGVYVATARMLAAAASDYQFIMARRVINEACRVALIAARRYIGEKVRVNGSARNTILPGNPGAPGTIKEIQAKRIESFIAARVEAALGEHASEIVVRVNRTSNIILTRNLSFEVSVVPLGYFHSVTGSVGLADPATLAVA